MKKMDFILPKWGGAMVHSDPQMTDNIDLPVPKNNVDIVWYKNELKGEKAGTMGNGIAGNGKIAVNTFNGLKDNLVIYDYHGNHLWTSGNKLNAIATSSTPMVDINNRVIACDNKKILMVGPNDNDGYGVLWSKNISYEGPGLWNTGVVLPFSPTIVNGKTIILPTKSGPVYAYDVNKGNLLAETYLGSGEITAGKGYFSTINSACVNGNRVYITTEYTIPTNHLRKISLGRLYAIDVNPDADNEKLTVAWYYPFIGRSQASPLLIDDTIYFDVYKPGLGLLEKPCVYAVTDKGDNYEEKWRVRYPKLLSFPKVPRGRTWFSFSKDPRGGLWYEDLRGKRLVRFKEDDGSIIEEILIKNLVQERGLGIYWPLSCMTICDEINPIMIISAISLLYNKYVVAVDLNANNSVLWKVKITSDLGFNYAGGQFTILKKNKDPSNNRILFGTYWDGVMAIGAADEN